MSHDGAIGIKTIRDDETKIILVDGASGDAATKKLSIVSDGEAVSATNNDKGIPCMIEDKDGNYQILKLNSNDQLPVDIDPLTDAGSTPDRVLIGDGTDTLLISDDGEANVSVPKVQGTDGAEAPVQAFQVGGKDVNGNLQVLSTDTSGKLNVNAAITEPAVADKVCNFFSQASQAINTEKLFFYVVPNGKTFHGKFLDCGADGKILIKYGTSSDGLALDGQKHQSWQQPKDTKQMAIPCLTLLGDGTKAICVAITPLDGGADDICATLQGTLV